MASNSELESQLLGELDEVYNKYLKLHLSVPQVMGCGRLAELKLFSYLEKCAKPIIEKVTTNINNLKIK